jgi:hypothetical protein
MGVAASASLRSTKVKPAFVGPNRLPWEDLEGQLSNPGGALKQLLKSWRKLPPNARPQVRATSPRIPQRAEERLGPNGVAQQCADYGAGRSTKEDVADLGGWVRRVGAVRVLGRRRLRWHVVVGLFPTAAADQ